MTPESVARGREVPRKTLHLTTASIPVGLWLGISQQAIAAVLVALFGIACLVELLRRRSTVFADRFASAVGIMLRPHEVRRGVTGATWLLAAFALTLLVAPRAAAIAATWAGAVGDALAAIVGSSWSRWRGMTGKTHAGSIACAIVTGLGAFGLAGFGLAPAAALGVLAALVERPAVDVDDNVRVTLAVAIGAMLLLRI